LEIDPIRVEVYRPEMKRVLAFINPTTKELEELDQIVPEILRTVAGKSKEYCMQTQPLITDSVIKSNQMNNSFMHGGPGEMNITQLQLNKNERLLNATSQMDPEQITIGKFYFF
jgi:hypothetical protein